MVYVISDEMIVKETRDNISNATSNSHAVHTKKKKKKNILKLKKKKKIN